MDDLSSYSKNNQIEIVEITIKKPGGDAIDISDIMEEVIIHEDMCENVISGKLIIMDQVNLVGTLPIVGGEEFYIKFKTPVRSDYREVKLIVYRVGDRDIPNDNSNIQVNILYLCTPETWWAANNDIGNGIQGTYSDIVDKLIKLTGTQKTLDKDDSIGVTTFVAPLWNVFKCVSYCATRANSQSMAPYFFWETIQGYHFKSLKTLYDSASVKRIYIQDRTVMGSESNPDGVFNGVYSYEYLDSNDRLTQFRHMAFGGDALIVDPTTRQIQKMNYSYDDFFNKNGIHVEGFQLNDGMKDKRSHLSLIYNQSDDSQLGSYARNASISFMDNVKLMVSIPGDSLLKAGDMVWLEIPVRVGTETGPETHTSGKWLVRSLKHLIQKVSYTQVCELTKDSFAIAVN